MLKSAKIVAPTPPKMVVTQNKTKQNKPRPECNDNPYPTATHNPPCFVLLAREKDHPGGFGEQFL